MRAFPGEPEALRLAPFAASSGRRAGYAGRKRPGTVGLPRPSHDAAFHEETVKIGFVSLLGDSRFLYATLFYVMTSILGILASFGHFFTSKSRQSGLAGSKLADRAGSGGCRRLRCIRIARESADSISLRHPAWIVRAGPLVLAHAMA